MENNYCVIMAGGVGSRFWPAGTAEKPKQFLDVLGTGESLLMQTYQRMLAVCLPENFYVVTNDIYKDLVLEQLPALKAHQVLTEPLMRNTAPCVAYAAFKIAAVNPDFTKTNMIVTPADHLITKERQFEDVLKSGLENVKNKDSLVTMGVQPHRADTGYGYIEFDDSEKKNVYPVKRFTEKPDLKTAQEFLKSGNFFWNSGMFIWRTEVILNAFKNLSPEIYELFKTGQKAFAENEDHNVLAEIYAQCPEISIDYAIMEQSPDVQMIKADIGWSDLGTWGSLYEVLDKDANGNFDFRAGAIFQDAKGNLVKVPKGKAVVVQGLQDCIVVDTEKALLIIKRDNEQNVKKFRAAVSEKFGKNFI